jgi:transposase
MKRSALVDAAGVPLGRVLAPANRHDSPLLGHTLDILDELGPLPAQVTVHLDGGFDSDKTRTELAERGLRGQIAERGTPAPIQAGRRWPVERTHAWQNAFNRLQRCHERRQRVIDAFFDLADAIITVRKIIRMPGPTTGGTPDPNDAPEDHLSARPLSQKHLTSRDRVGC